MPESWPLADEVLLDGYDEAFPDLLLRTQMDAPIAKVRRRFTAVAVPLRCAIPASTDDVSTLETFFLTTLSGGSLSFSWVHPRKGTSVTMRFVSPPRPAPLGGDRWSVALDLEILP